MKGLYMSILLVEVVPQGIIFGADRNVTFSKVVQQQRIQDDQVTIETRKEIHGQSQSPKVLRWPQRKALIGYVGAAEIGGMPTHEWLYNFIGNNLTFSNFEELSESLRLQVESQRRIDEGANESDPLLIHLGGFEEQDGVQLPVIWFVRNAWGYEQGYTDIRKEYQRSEEFLNVYSTFTPEQIRPTLEQRASHYDPFWFHQGFDLGTFNKLESFLKAAFKELCNSLPGHSVPQTLSDWEAQVRMSILTYSAYFQAYKGPSEQFVGGGVDTVSIAWP